jgi:outer membrane protein OmpA-like peptidoglycan-associated protein
MTNIVTNILGALSPNAMTQIAALTGETDGRAQKAISAIVPVLLAGAISKSKSAGGADLLAMVNSAVASGNPVDTIGSMLASDAGRAGLLNDGGTIAAALLGEQASAVVSATAALADAKPESVRGILAIVSPLVLGGLAKGVGPLPTAQGIADYLTAQTNAISRALPPGLRTLFNLPQPLPEPKPEVRRTVIGARLPDDGEPYLFKPKNYPIMWILLGAGVLALLYSLVGQKRDRYSLPAPAPVAAQADETVALPDGSTIVVRTGTIGSNLARYLASEEPAPRTFVFDNLNFDTAENKVTPESVPTLTAIIAILKAYPASKATISGYTDNVGDPTANLALSTARSATVAKALVDSGIDPARIATEGFGEANPVADNMTEGGRAQNRRTELTVTEK